MLTRVLVLLIALSVINGCGAHHDSSAEQKQRIEKWQQQRAVSLRSENGWLTLAGLLWLKQGSNHVSLNASNELTLDTAPTNKEIGTFDLQDKALQFIASAGSGVKYQDQAVTRIKMTTDASDKPTGLTLGSLSFYAIERGGQTGIRVRDSERPSRKNFSGLNYFPINYDWYVAARYEPYVPSKHIAIVNILGMTEQMESPGALVFEKDGQTWRVDTVIESPTDKDLFVMIHDATSGRDTYGAGRYMYVPKPTGEQLWLDFNQAFNPPCAFTEFATCPLPPKQNWVQLAITAGEKKYAQR